MDHEPVAYLAAICISMTVFTSQNHLQLQQHASSSSHGSEKYRIDASDRSWTPHPSIVPTRIPMPTECWILKVLTILIPRTSVITHDYRSKTTAH